VEVAAWRKSSQGSPRGNVHPEVDDAYRVILVRDTTDRDGTVLRLSPAAWRRFGGTLA
jgi:hypothetical protein